MVKVGREKKERRERRKRKRRRKLGAVFIMVVVVETMALWRSWFSIWAVLLRTECRFLAIPIDFKMHVISLTVHRLPFG